MRARRSGGRKRRILVDMLGLLLSVAVHAANIQDRDGVVPVLDRRTRRLFPFIERIYGDSSTQRWNDVPRGTMDEVSSYVRLNLPSHCRQPRSKDLFHLVFESHDGRALVPSPKRSASP